MDQEWRALERAWRSDRGDQGALLALIAALRRTGQPVSRELLDARRFPTPAIPATRDFVLEGLVSPDGWSGHEGRGSLWGYTLNVPFGPDDERELTEAAARGATAIRITTGREATAEALTSSLARISALPLLRHLRLWSWRHLTAADADALSASRSLETIDCSTRLEEGALTALAGLPGLAWLTLTDCLTSTIAPELGRLTGLVALQVRMSYDPVDLLRELRRCPVLSALSLSANGGDARALANLLPLEELDLVHTPDLRDLPALAALTRLRRLRVRASDADCVALATLPRLEEVVLWGPPPRLGLTRALTDVGLASIAAAPSLRWLEVDDSDVTQEGVERLRRLRRGLEVRHVPRQPRSNSGGRADGLEASDGW